MTMDAPTAARTPEGRGSAPASTGMAAAADRGPFSARGELYAATAAGLLLLAWLVLDLTAGEVRWLAWASLSIGLVYGLRAALESLRGRRVDIDVLMVVGAGLAAYIGHPEDGALLLFLFVLAGSLEALAAQRTKREIEALHRLMPTDALSMGPDGRWRHVAPEALAEGDRIKILPGERIPTDARLESGESSIDQSAVTGESMPRHVRPGDELFAGTINAGDAIEATVLRPVGQSSLQRILDLVTEAREQREPVQRLIDRLSQPYALGVMGTSAAVFLAWWLVLGQAWESAAYTAITLLIVASPCALIIATPTATLAAIARAARAGVLFKGGIALDALSGVSAVCFDKTGTLTIGRPRLGQVHAVAWSDADRLLALAAGVEQESTHPIASAVREAAVARGVAPAAVERISLTRGRGVSGTYRGCPVRLGSYTHVEALVPMCFRARVREVLERIQDRGHIGVVVAHACPSAAGGGEAAVLIMADEVRPGAPTLVHDLHALGIRPVRMLTGDNRTTARHVAEALGIDRYDAELLPEHKVDAVREMKKDGRVAVIGDGVNDAPALAAADVSVAIGSIGSDAALESADIVLLADDLGMVPWAVGLARRARRTVRQNIAFALSVIVGMGVATLVMSLGPWRVPLSLGVLAHEGGTLVVVANSLRLLWVRGRPAVCLGTDGAADPAAPGTRSSLAPGPTPVGDLSC
ncbi:MAG: cation-translocating P-type ATPase [Phycisphaerae bacterium]|nr:cation-translocating P-type ATPase [Phycisphaerae bacterium]